MGSAPCFAAWLVNTSPCWVRFFLARPLSLSLCLTVRLCLCWFAEKAAKKKKTTTTSIVPIKEKESDGDNDEDKKNGGQDPTKQRAVNHKSYRWNHLAD